MERSTLRILLSSNARDGAERINNLFRNAGKPAQTHRVTSREDLIDCINDQQWDLALCEEKNDALDTDVFLGQIAEAKLDTPIILLANSIDNSTIVSGMTRGASDVISINANDHLLHAANREIFNLDVRRSQAVLRRSLNEISSRFDTLMSQADDAVAYIIDGMHVDVNEAYAELFAYEGPEDFLAIPVVDLINNDEQDKFKSFLKSYNEEGEQELTLNCVNANNEPFQAHMKFAPAVFDEEKCTQLVLRKIQEADSDTVQVTAVTTDPKTGLNTRYHFVDKLNLFLAQEEPKGSLLYISINDFRELKSRMGLSGGLTIRYRVAELLKEKFSDRPELEVTHYGEDSFTVLMPDVGTDEAMQASRDFCNIVEDTIFELDQLTAQCSCSVGVIDFKSVRFVDANETMDAAFVALDEAHQQFLIDHSVPGVILYRPKSGDSVEVLFDLEGLIRDQRLHMMFQPIINLHGERLECYEATLRLFDAGGDEQSIDTFIQSMNQKNGDTALDKWLVIEGTKTLKKQHEENKETTLSINLTQNALLDDEFCSWLCTAIKAAEVPAECIILQFQESTIAHYLKQAIRFFDYLQSRNFKFSMSHFGRTMESFKLLPHFKADYVIVDGNFTLDLQKDPSKAESLKTMLNRLKETKTQSILPLVENAATLASLWQMNVHYIQGYYLKVPSEKMDYEFAEMA